MDRGGDLLARYGGEEFVAVLPGTTLNGARFVAEQMRQAISQWDFGAETGAQLVDPIVLMDIRTRYWIPACAGKTAWEVFIH